MRQNIGCTAHLARTQVENFVKHAGIRCQVTCGAGFPETGNRLPDNDHYHGQNGRKQRGVKNSDPLPQRAEAETVHAGNSTDHFKDTVNFLERLPEMTTLLAVSLPGARRRGCHRVILAEPLGTPDTVMMPLWSVLPENGVSTTRI